MQASFLPPVVNPDGVSVKGCKYIYAPAGQAGEYAPLAANPYRGCGHKCVYCYVPKQVLRIDRKVFDAGAIVRNDGDYLDFLLDDAAKYKAAGLTGQVMISFTSDPYHPGDTTVTRRAFDMLQEHGLAICPLTKGGTRSLRDISIFRPDRDAFASTLTSLDDRFSRKWERDAALPADRIAALRKFHERGIFTWVSLEPTIDIESSLAIVDKTYDFVDLYKVGRVNYLAITKTTDWRTYTLRMIDKLQSLGQAHYIKRDLQCYLPPGYHNPLRVEQHH
jgi:DNA repair photolyase